MYTSKLPQEKEYRLDQNSYTVCRAYLRFPQDRTLAHPIPIQPAYAMMPYRSQKRIEQGACVLWTAEFTSGNGDRNSGHGLLMEVHCHSGKYLTWLPLPIHLLPSCTSQCASSWATFCGYTYRGSLDPHPKRLLQDWMLDNRRYDEAFGHNQVRSLHVYADFPVYGTWGRCMNTLTEITLHVLQPITSSECAEY